MKNLNVLFISLALVSLMTSGCATDNRQPASNRSGRDYQEPRAMNHRSLDSNTLYQACLRERSEVSCRNRLGR